MRPPTSVLAGTIFHRTRTPLPVWFRAMWYVTSQKSGASALGLQRVLGLGSYETAWTWLDKLRMCQMVRPGRDQLSGWVEVDETWLGRWEEGIAGRKKGEKALIVIAAEADGPGIGRIRTDAASRTLRPEGRIPSSKTALLRAALCIPMPGRVTSDWRRRATSGSSPSCGGDEERSRRCCPESIGSPRC